ncbi:MAG: hypothetical protein KKE44_03835 [Proteobacteria bacterium]|nr:hypothetical protein [Pseudomonadota bacterium]MBU1581859.1 hypothetical protein [Pseudomonadota bacterium]MBU2454931.1 hypothetical protein [Pseudomonadota bacterium]MBU2631577.1 hypothetical protein [Pseudomonadota bacterium]
MYAPLHYQVSEYDCVPTAFINAVTYLFERAEIPPMVISHIYLYSLDTVGRNAMFGIGGTSKYAVRMLGNWLSSYKMKKFSVYTEFLEKYEVSLKDGSRIHTCLQDGGIALFNMLLKPKEEHYIMALGMDDETVYFFDSYRRMSIRGMKDKASILPCEDGRSPNLKIKRDWLSQETSQRFCLGPVHLRECLLIWRTS